MVKPSTRPRKKQDDGSINALFSGAADPALDTDLQAEIAKGKAEDPTAPLLAQIAALNARVDEMAKANNASMTAAPQVPQFGKEPVLDLSGLPDAQFDSDAYTKAHGQRTQDYIKATLAYQRSVDEASRSAQSSQTQKAESLWDEFQAAYPAHSDGNDKLVLFASQQVVDSAKARGLDAEKYMFSNRGQFMKEVADTMDNIRGVPFGKDQAQGEGEGQEEDEAPTRTMGVFGNGSPMLPPKASQEKAQAGDMISEIHDLQRKSGFF